MLIYLAALIVLFVSAFWSVDSFTGKLVHSWTFHNFQTLVDDPTYRTIALRTVTIAAAVTLTDALLALPFAFYAARVASTAAPLGPVRRGAPSAVVQLPGARIRLAADPRP